MNPSHIPGMLFSPAAGWTDLLIRHPSPRRLLVCVFAPLAILPPAMVLLSADTFGASAFPDVTFSSWILVAALLLIAECAGLLFMTRLIKETARANHGTPRTYDAFMVALIAPIPMWLSTLALPTANVPVIAGVSLAGITASAFLIRHGARALLGVREVTEAGQTAFLVMCAGALAWACMTAIILLPVILLG